VLNPVDPATGRNAIGRRQLRVGDATFFLQPGEILEKNKIESVIVLGEDEALLLMAMDDFVDAPGPAAASTAKASKSKKKASSSSSSSSDAAGEAAAEAPRRVAGDRWMVHGPCDFIPRVEISVVERRRIIPLHENEGVYVRDLTTGEVRSVIGRSYMLSAREELWNKPLPEDVERLLTKTGRDERDAGQAVRRDASRVVTFQAPHNSAVQVYVQTRARASVLLARARSLALPFARRTADDDARAQSLLLPRSCSSALPPTPSPTSLTHARTGTTIARMRRASSSARSS